METRKFTFKDLPDLLKSAFKDITDDYGFMFSAALSYYGVFALPAVLFIIIYVAGLVVGESAVQDQITAKIGSLLGEEASSQMTSMISQKGSSGSSGLLMKIVGIATLVLSASAGVMHLQKALNRIWEVKQDPDAGIGTTVSKRLLSILVVVGLGIMMLAFIMISSFWSAFSNQITQSLNLPQYINGVFWVANFAISFGFIWLLFAVVFKVVPDAKITFSTVWVGSGVTAFLFVLGQFAISFYLTKANPGEAYGPAGPIIVLMVWFYYSALITLLGAEITQAYAKKYQRGIRPSKHALKVITRYEKDPHDISEHEHRQPRAAS